MVSNLIQAGVLQHPTSIIESHSHRLQSASRRRRTPNKKRQSLPNDAAVCTSLWCPVTIESVPTEKIIYNIPAKKQPTVSASISKRFRFLKLPRVQFKDHLLTPYTATTDPAISNDDYDPKLNHEAFEENDLIIAVEHCCDCDEHNR